MAAPFTPLFREDVAAVLNIEVRCLSDWISKGEVVAPKIIGSRVMWHPEVFYAWLDERLRNGKDATEGRPVSPARPAIIPATRKRQAPSVEASGIQEYMAREEAKLRAMADGTAPETWDKTAQ